MFVNFFTRKNANKIFVQDAEMDRNALLTLAMKDDVISKTTDLLAEV